MLAKTQLLKHRINQTLSQDLGGGSRPLTWFGPGILTLTGANTYTGTTTVNGGTLKMTYGVNNGGVGTLGVGSSITVNSGGTLLGSGFNALGHSSTHAGDLLTVNVGGVFRVDAGNVLSMPYALNIVGGTISSVDGGFPGFGTIFYASTQGTFTSAIDGTPATISAQRFYLAGAQFNVVSGGGAVDLNVTGTLASNGGGLTKNGNGVMNLTNNNTYNGTTTINAGTLTISNASGLGIGSVVTVNGTLTYTVDTTGTRTVTVNSGGVINKGGFTHASTTFVNNGGTINA
jgi:autotransporter-associated beta strand protein